MISSQDNYIIINYHYVEDPRAAWGGIHPCPVKEFEKQISFLSKNYEIVSVGQVFDFARKESKGKFCAITFDDGLKGQYDNAVPILNKYKVRGTFFPITSTFEGSLPATHKIHVLLSKLSSSELIDVFHRFLGEFYSDLKVVYFIPTDKRLFERRQHEDIPTANFKETMIGLPEDVKGRFLRYCFKTTRLDEKKLSRQIFMSQTQILELRDQDMEIGNHSHGHYALDTLGGDVLKRDIRLANTVLKDLLAKTPVIFSYPHGRAGVSTIKVLAEEGFKYAVTIEPMAVSKNDQAMLIPRYDTNDVQDFLNLNKTD
ncbi:MAG: polysaccharide deacetylase family protein [bacterium]|nr:polysaccharide deacetylase family protein [bacterium]